MLVYLRKLTMLIPDSKYEIQDFTFELTNEIIELKSCVLATSKSSIKRSLNVIMLCYLQITDYLHDSFNMGYKDLSVKKQQHKTQNHIHTQNKICFRLFYTFILEKRE